MKVSLNKRFNACIISYDTDSWLVFMVLQDVLGRAALDYNYTMDTQYYPSVLTYFNCDYNMLTIIEDVLDKVLDHEYESRYLREIY